MSDLEKAIPIIDAFFPAGLRRCVNVRKVYDLLDLNDSASHWFTRILMPINPSCIEGDDYITVRINSAPVVLSDGNFYQYDGPRMGIDILCILEKVIPAIRKTKSANAYAIAQYLTNALHSEPEPAPEPEPEPVKEPDADFFQSVMQEEPKQTGLTVFENPQFGKVRVIMRENDPWFVAKDVCDCLGLSDVSMTIKSLDDDEKGTSIICTPGGNQEMSIISEAGFYSLVLRSRKPEAKEFKRWVTHEVLPSIRKTGSYSRGQEIPTNYVLTDVRGNKYTLKLYPA